VAFSTTTAALLMTIVKDCGKELFAALPALQSELSEDEFRKMKREIARVITTMDSAISAKVATEYPDLVPEAVPIAHKL
jgi:ribosomal protein L29